MLVIFCNILFNILHISSNTLLHRHVPIFCPIYNHISDLIPEIYFGLIYLISIEFEDGLYLYERNARVVIYTQYIIDISQDILILLKAVTFNLRPVPHISVRLDKKEPNVIQSVGKMRTQCCPNRLKAIKCHPKNHNCSILRAKIRASTSPNILSTCSSQIGVLYFT